jgi:hypothetical protein
MPKLPKSHVALQQRGLQWRDISLHLSDPMSGYFVIRRSAIKNIERPSCW